MAILGLEIRYFQLCRTVKRLLKHYQDDPLKRSANTSHIDKI